MKGGDPSQAITNKKKSPVYSIVSFAPTRNGWGSLFAQRKLFYTSNTRNMAMTNAQPFFSTFRKLC